jgi:predicted homoserine dehydrogenase-like protein
MTTGKFVKLGIIGLGNMGQSHATKILAGEVPGLKLVAVADADASQLLKYPDAVHFSDGMDLIPHYSR